VGAENVIRAGQAARSYSCSRPPSRSCRRMRRRVSVAGSVIGSAIRPRHHRVDAKERRDGHARRRNRLIATRPLVVLLADVTIRTRAAALVGHVGLTARARRALPYPSAGSGVQPQGSRHHNERLPALTCTTCHATRGGSRRLLRGCSAERSDRIWRDDEIAQRYTCGPRRGRHTATLIAVDLGEHRM
jgi:hypothetical protein